MQASFRLQETQADTTDTTEIRADTTETGTATIENTPASPTVPMQDITRRTLDTAETSGGTGADTPETRIVPPSVQIQDPVRGTEFVDDALTPEMARNRSTDVRDDPFTLETAILNAEVTIIAFSVIIVPRDNSANGYILHPVDILAFSFFSR
ncbi:hypothetical protein BC938DRAFT_476947 [Jimgerdemannia flammicorona]|uniref:Uncharacterized protein n=1 Tax=Jimgerdemannia flammicorona TaxID=994334 RepID=A0A433QPZ8_9FUNG|nr:hypothetical protein BC938DRAFT_476947 [Jimgerdemannia flammicorona]